MAPYPGFFGGSYASQSVIADQERTVNLYVERMESEGATHALALYPTPGFTAFSGVAQGITDIGCRAIWAGLVANVERCFAVIGTGFYELFLDGTVTKRGTVTQDNNLATINYNGSVGGHLFITSGTNGYSYVLSSNTLALQLTGLATMGAFAHGYFLAFNVKTGKVLESALNDGTTWDLTNFFQRSLLADPWQAMFVDGNSLVWLPGTNSFEVWYDTGTGLQPFAPLSGLVGPHGIASPFGFALAGQTILWLTRNSQGAGEVVTLKGGAQAVSTYPVAAAISSYQRSQIITDAETLVYQEVGHTFVNWAFPSVPATWTYDATQPGWAERGTWNSVRGNYDLWAPRVHGYAFGKHLVGFRTTGTIATMDSTVSTELDGTGIRRLRRAPGITREHARLPFDRLELLMDSGVGLSGTGQGSNPQIMLRVSRDGGRTWGNERIAGLGRMGEYGRRVYWNRLGSLRNAVVEVSWTDPVLGRVVDAWINNTESQQAA